MFANYFGNVLDDLRFPLNKAFTKQTSFAFFNDNTYEMRIFLKKLFIFANFISIKQ